MEISSINQLDLTKTYSYADYLVWKFGERVELLKGYILQMAAPKRQHQKVLRKLNHFFDNFFYKKPCEVYFAPFDVRLYDRKKSELLDKEVFTVVQPDLCVVCDLEKLDEKGCNGSPEFIIEIVSPSNARRDVKDKFEIYEQTGVLEYWIVRPDEKTVSQFILENEKYRFGGIFTDEEKIRPFLFPDLEVDLAEIFEE